MGYWEPLAGIVEWPREDGNDVRDIRAASNTRRRPRVRVQVRLHKPKARRFSSAASSVGRSQQGTARPASGNPQPTPPPSPPHEQARGSWSPPLCACQRSGKPISEHLLDAAVLRAIKGSVDHRRAESLLRMWWAESPRSALHRPTVSPDDEVLLHDTLHHLATHGPPDEASSPQLGDGDTVTIELAGRGLGPAGSVQVPVVSRHSGQIPTSRGRAKQPPQRRNHHARRSPRCCAGYMLMASSTNPSCPQMLVLLLNTKAWPSARLLSLCRPSTMLARSRQGHSACPHLRASRDCCAPCGGGWAWGAKIDLSNCYQSVQLPPAMAGAVCVAVVGTTYALVRVPFGWHQALGLVQHLIAAVLCELPDTQVIIVQYLDDILFVGRGRQVTTRVARDTAAHLARKGFIVSPKQCLMPRSPSRGWGSRSA